MGKLPGGKPESGRGPHGRLDNGLVGGDAAPKARGECSGRVRKDESGNPERRVRVVPPAGDLRWRDEHLQAQMW